MTDAASQIAEYNEAYYGEMFILSDSEEMKVMAGAEKEIQAKFKP
jgi:hypothetical protein